MYFYLRQSDCSMEIEKLPSLMSVFRISYKGIKLPEYLKSNLVLSPSRTFAPAIQLAENLFGSPSIKWFSFEE